MNLEGEGLRKGTSGWSYDMAHWKLCFFSGHPAACRGVVGEMFSDSRAWMEGQIEMLRVNSDP